MSSALSYFRALDGTVAVATRVEMGAIIDSWGSLRRKMVVGRPEHFSRDEWAYLIAFLDPSNLRQVLEVSFGAASAPQPPKRLYRARKSVALWLPNNVSLLGPLTLILVSIAGTSMAIKAGSNSVNLTSALIDFALSHLSEAAAPLREHLQNQVRCDSFGRDDARNRQMAADAEIRIAFGSDAAAIAIDQLPHPVHSRGFYFADKRSEAWLQAGAVDDRTLMDLLRVFAIYGQAGCTSPKRVVLLEADEIEADALRDRLVALWPRLAAPKAQPHVASANLMAQQWCAALGWRPRLVDGHGAVIAAGSIEAPLCPAPFLLSVVAGSVQDALDTLPANIQTIGYALQDAGDPKWLGHLAAIPVKRFVPLRNMHHFGPLWDGHEMWRELFEVVEVGQWSANTH